MGGKTSLCGEFEKKSQKHRILKKNGQTLVVVGGGKRYYFGLWGGRAWPRSPPLDPPVDLVERPAGLLQSLADLDNFNA